MAKAERIGTSANQDRSATAIAVLQQRFGERLQTGEALRRQHANTLTWIPNQPPDAVIWVETTDEVRQVVRVAATHGTPIIPFGAGTSLEGHINAPRGGLSLDFSRMNRVLTVNERDLDCVVEAGVSRKQLNDHLRDLGLFFPVDPGAEEATIGGMASTRASGTTAVRYGTMRENVLNLTAVMADGSIIKTAQRARKSAAGYDLTRLLVGSEGTLGIITELTVRLYGIPERILAAVCPFETLEGACNAVIQSIQFGLGLARMELLDPPQIRAVNSYAKLGLEEKPTLFLEFKARHDVYWAIKTVFPGRDAFATDVCVPISRLAECVLQTQQDIEASGLIAPIVGHVGDGNFHTTPVFDRNDPAQRAAVEGFLARLVERAIAMEGTCTGEHGVGQGKAKYLKAELGDGLAVMRSIKAALDPQDILNPGKILSL
jgi:D-lactate dehydrogenase (cytochrome)